MKPYITIFRLPQPACRLIQPVCQIAARRGPDIDRLLLGNGRSPDGNGAFETVKEPAFDFRKPLIEDLIDGFPPAGVELLAHVIEMNLPRCTDLLTRESPGLGYRSLELGLAIGLPERRVCIVWIVTHGPETSF
jgi:hypothetical protein